MLRFVTTADTEILAAAAAVRRLPDRFPDVRCANPGGAPEPADLLDDLLDGARVVLCRILGGRRGWPDGFELLRAQCAANGIALLCLGGEAAPDAEMTALSLAPAGAVAQAGEYLRHGDVENIEQLLRFLADTFLLEGFGFEPPHEVPDLGVYMPGSGEMPIDEALAMLEPGRPTIGVCFYRSHRLTGNTAFVDGLCEALAQAGANALPVWSYTLRRDANGEVPALALLEGHVDALIVTMLATGGSGAADASIAPASAPDGAGPAWQEWDAGALARLDVPVFQAVCATSTRAAWEASDSGLQPLDAATQVAIPEFDGRIGAGVISFKERDAEGSPVGAAVPSYVAEPERCARVAKLAVRHASLRRLPAAQRRVAMLLTSFPTKHARIGMAVGLDTPASALKVLDAFHEDGMQVEPSLRARRRADAGADRDRRPRPRVRDRRAARGGDAPAAGRRLRSLVRDAAGVTARIDREALGTASRRPFRRGWRFRDRRASSSATCSSRSSRRAATARIRSGSTTTRSCRRPTTTSPPTGGIDAVWGADAIVHLGKHGTLEWLPGKMLALSAGCAPDAALGDMPLIYPFVVNDPGEGVQAKRRAHAVIVDHLVPPMMRAETYDELAELETLLDEYARVEVLDPSKLPALAGRIWSAIEAANLQSDLGVERAPRRRRRAGRAHRRLPLRSEGHPDQDGLHVLGERARGRAAARPRPAMLRLGSGEVAGLRSAVAAALGVDPEAEDRTGVDRLEASNGRCWSARRTRAGTRLGCRRLRGGARPARRWGRADARVRVQRDRAAHPRHPTSSTT